LRVRYLAVEGVTGVGKARLARLLGARLNARLVMEDAEDNPFLPLYYEDPERYGFQAQVFFLLGRYRQLQELRQMDLFQSAVVGNCLFARDRVYAHLILNDAELSLYERLAETLRSEVPRPDLVVYLQDSVHNILRRIRERGRGYERVVTEDYLGRLVEAYTHFFFHYSETPLLVVNVSKADLSEGSADLEGLVQQVMSPPAGTRYYRPMQAGT